MQINQRITDRTDESIKQYFKDVSKYPRITKEEEIELGTAIQNGDEKAFHKLVTSNLRFAISIAKQYQHKGLPLVDLIQAANEGLMFAARLFNPETNNKFISFAVWHIRQFVTKALSDQSRTVRLPTSHIQAVAKIHKITNQYLQEYGRDPSQDELYSEMDISRSRILNGLTVANKSVSLDTPIKDVDGGTLLDITPSNMFNVTDDNMNRADLRKALEVVLSKLPPRNSDLIRLTFGIGVDPFTLDEAGRMFGIGAERVRQIIQRTLVQIKRQYKGLLKHVM